MNQSLNQALKIIALSFTLIFLIAGYMTISAKRSGRSVVAVTPTEIIPATDTPVKPAATATKQATATNTATPTQTSSPTATASSTPSATFTATISPTAQISATATLSAPIATATAIIVATETPGPPTATETPPGPPTETPTPTITPTPVPRTVLANDAPDFTQAEAHFWFVRPFAEEFDTHGSWFYPYGTNNNGEYLWHKGIDIQNEAGTPVLAVGDGLVVFAATDNAQAIGPQTDFYGQAVVIQHSNAFTVGEEEISVYTLYGHVSELLVAEGETVTAGQPIALTGQEGIALGPHLHLEVRLRENNYLATQNPDLWIRPDPGQGVIAGRVVDANGFYVPQQLITLHRAAEPDRFYRQTRTYPDHRYQFDPQLGETFTFADVPAGDYIVKTSFDGRNYEAPLKVSNQQTSFVLIQGQTPPPTPEPTLTPTATPTPTETPLTQDAPTPES